jgi:hypothetical protein
MTRRGKESLLDDEITQELLADQLSDALSDCENDKSSNYDDDDFDCGPSTSQKSRKRARLEASDSDVNIVDDDDDDVWTSNDDLRNFEQFLGNTGFTFTPNDPTSISEPLSLGIIILKFL